MATASGAAASIPGDAEPDDLDLDHIPSGSVERFWGLVSTADEAYTRLSASFDRANEIKSEKRRAEVELVALEQADRRGEVFRIDGRNRDWSDQHQPGQMPQPLLSKVRDEPRLNAAQRRVDAIAERLAKEQERHAAASAQWQAASRIVGRSRQYLQLTRRVMLRPAAHVEPTLKRGESPGAAVERVRGEIIALRQEMRSVGKAPATLAEAKERMRRLVNDLARQGEPAVAGLFAGGGIRWPVMPATASGYGKVDGAKLFAAVLEDQLIAYLDRLIDQHGSTLGGPMMTAGQRTARLTEIERNILSLGYVEQATLDKAAAGGHLIMPRADADIRAVLWLAPESPEPKN